LFSTLIMDFDSADLTARKNPVANNAVMATEEIM
jgi:hypothetical protein